jgi:inorganic pyrophosphatase
MPNFIYLPPFAEDGAVHVVIETPRGNRAKFAYDPKLETFTLTKSLLVGLTHPTTGALFHRPRPMTAISSMLWSL